MKEKVYKIDYLLNGISISTLALLLHEKAIGDASIIFFLIKKLEMS